MMSEVKSAQGAESLEIEDCLLKISEKVSMQETERVLLSQACGCVLAEDIYSGMMVPPYPKSAMDGYAVYHGEVSGATREEPVTLRVVGEMLAGDYKEIPYEHGTAVRIMTGAYVPEGYDAVVRQEDTDYGEEQVAIYAPVPSYRNYCKTGEDIEAGEKVLSAGTRLNALHIGLLAGIGADRVLVRRPLRVAIISTGSELAEVGASLTPGKIYNSISYLLAAEIRREGLQVSVQTTCADEEQLLKDTLRQALAVSDLVITTGGVSVGKKDIVPKVLADMGAELLFRRARIQPGTPTTAGILEGKPVLSLSGNPYAAVVNFEYYFWNLAAQMMGQESYRPIRTTAILQSEYTKVNKMRRFIRAKAEGGQVFLPTAEHASSVISNMTECNCFIDMEAGRQVKVGEEVQIQFFKGM